MSNSIEEKIVKMTFQAADFVKNTSTVISALAKLKSSLNLSGSAKSLDDIDAAGKRFSLAGMAQNVEGMASKFSALGTIGVAALATIASRAVSAGLSLVKSFTIDPIKAGLDVYETKINAIQTILANTQSEGTRLKDVTGALNELNTYANKTVYNFGEMAHNIGTFTAAGVSLKSSVSSIKGIANLAALSGSSAEQASTAMYQLSQAIANGKVNLQDWNSVVNAGLGGKVFQTALENTARATGVNIDAIIKKAGSFRNSLQQGWLSSKILTQTLSTFTGDLSNQQLKSMGYSQQQIKQIQATAKAAVQSATQIRTVTQLHQALAEEVATAWSRVWEAVIGNSTEATKTLSAIHNTLENAFTGPVNNLAKFLQQFDKLGGRTEVIHAIKTAFQEIGAVLKPIGQAFHDVFPPATAVELMNIVLMFENLEDKLHISKAAAADLRSTFDGLFSIIKIGVDVIKDVASGIISMFSGAGKAGSSVVNLTGHIGDFIVKIKDALENGSALATVFVDIGKVIGAPIKLIGLMVGAFGELGNAAKKVYGVIQPFIGTVVSAFSSLGSAIAQSISSGSFANVEHVLNQGLFGLILLQVRKFIKSFGEETEGGGFLDDIKGKITETFEGLTNTLKSMQNSLKATTLLKIAAAVGILTASVVALSFIDTGKLTSALTAITLMFTELLAGMAVISKIAGLGGIIQISVIAFALNELATAILILSGAVAILSAFSWTELAKGIGSIAVLLGALVASVKLMAGDTPGLIASASAMILIAAAMNLLALAVKQLGSMDFGTLLKGVGTITALLAVILAFQKFGGGEQMIASAAAMVLIGAALNIIAKAMESFGSMDWSSIAKSLVELAGSLSIIVLAMTFMPPDMIGTAAALLVVSAAMVVLSKALTTLGGMSWTQVAISLIELAGALTIMAAAMLLMVEGLPGAAALVVMAAALAILTPVLIALGGMSWVQLLTSLAALAGVFIILGAAGIVLAPLVPVLLGLGVAIALLGVGMLAAGAGVFLFATGITALAVALTASGVAIASFVRSIIALIPYAIAQVGQGIVQLAGIIGKDAPAIVAAFVALVSALLSAIVKIAPKIGSAVQAILTTFLGLINRNSGPILNTMANLLLRLLNTIASKAGQFANAASNLMINLINGITRNIPRIAAAGTNAIIAFINAVSAQAGRLANAGIQAVINMVNSMANAIRSHQSEMNAAGRNLGSAIVSGLIGGITGAIGGAVSAAANLAHSALSAAKNALLSHSPSLRFQWLGEDSGAGLVIGLNNSVKPVSAAGEALATVALNTVKDAMTNVGDFVMSNIDTTPKITPVIDLTEAQKGFTALNALSKSQLISADTSTNKATAISVQNAAAAEQAGLASAAGSKVEFNQYNTSPKALSTVEIYRQTNNQLSKLKGDLP